MMSRTLPWMLSLALLSLATNPDVMFASPVPQSVQTVQSSQPTVQSKADAGPQADSAADHTTGDSEAIKAENELPDAPTPAASVQQDQQSDSPSTLQNSPTVPSGTAAAKAPIVKGVPASRTVGAAIAPAPTHRTRSLIIKVGLIAGACVAVGSALALSKASPSRPPGAQ